MNNIHTLDALSQVTKLGDELSNLSSIEARLAFESESRPIPADLMTLPGTLPRGHVALRSAGFEPLRED